MRTQRFKRKQRHCCWHVKKLSPITLYFYYQTRSFIVRALSDCFCFFLHDIIVLANHTYCVTQHTVAFLLCINSTLAWQRFATSTKLRYDDMTYTHAILPVSMHRLSVPLFYITRGRCLCTTTTCISCNGVVKFTRLAIYYLYYHFARCTPGCCRLPLWQLPKKILISPKRSGGVKYITVYTRLGDAKVY